MEKIWIILLVLITLNLVSAVKINEVELNPEGEDRHNEWIELYSEDFINITDWEIKDLKNDSMYFNASFQGYFILNSSITLNNDAEKLFLYNKTELIFKTDELSDSENNGKSLQYCGEWILMENTKNSENSCEQPAKEEEIKLEMEWREDEIINGEEFEIDLKAYNLKNENYDIKVWIEYEDKVISEIYDEKEEKWKSGNYYVEEFFTGPGNKTGEVDLRLKENFEGEAYIHFRIKEYKEIKKSIEILENEGEIEKKEEKNAEITEKKGEKEMIVEEVINLNPEKAETIKTSNSEVIYESKEKKIREHSVLGFALLSLMLSIFLIFKKL